MEYCSECGVPLPGMMIGNGKGYSCRTCFRTEPLDKYEKDQRREDWQRLREENENLKKFNDKMQSEVLKKLDRMEKIILNAPHEAGCGTQQGRACTSICWKSKLKDI